MSVWFTVGVCSSSDRLFRFLFLFFAAEEKQLSCWGTIIQPIYPEILLVPVLLLPLTEILPFRPHRLLIDAVGSSRSVSSHFLKRGCFCFSGPLGGATEQPPGETSGDSQTQIRTCFCIRGQHSELLNNKHCWWTLVLKAAINMKYKIKCWKSFFLAVESAQFNLEENVFASPRRRGVRQINPDDNDGCAGLSQHSATVALRLSGPSDVAFLKQRAWSLIPGRNNWTLVPEIDCKCFLFLHCHTAGVLKAAG